MLDDIIALREQKVSIRKNDRSRWEAKTVKRTVHFIYFNPTSHRWTGQIHKERTEWQPVEYSLKHKKWFEIDEKRRARA